MEKTTPPTGPFREFREVCRAAGVAPGLDRIGVFPELPPDVQAEIWADVAREAEQERET
jgi:hypothetical protein